MLTMQIENTPEFYVKITALIIGSLAIGIAACTAYLRSLGADQGPGEWPSRLVLLGLIIMVIPWIVFGLAGQLS